MKKYVKKQLEYTVDQEVLEAAELIMAQAGITAESLIPMIYAEIVRTGKIPITMQVSEDDLNTARLIAASQEIPSVHIHSNSSLTLFLEDDGGY